METYKFYPPQMIPQQVPYQVISDGATDCQHRVSQNGWQNKVTVQDGVLFIAFSCTDCGRTLCQSFDPVTPPSSWNGSATKL